MYNVWVITSGDKMWSSNQVDYATVDDALVGGAGLFDRWYAVDKWAVLPKGPNGHLTDQMVVDNAVGGIHS